MRCQIFHASRLSFRTSTTRTVCRAPQLDFRSDTSGRGNHYSRRCVDRRQHCRHRGMCGRAATRRDVGDQRSRIRGRYLPNGRKAPKWRPASSSGSPRPTICRNRRSCRVWLQLMRSDPSIRSGFCDSRSIDANGAPVYSSYKPYFSSLEPNALTRTEVFRGTEFVTRFLSVKNTILNVSSVVWRREALLSALATCRKRSGAISYGGRLADLFGMPSGARMRKSLMMADPLNVHRRHAQSVTHAFKAQKHVEEIAAVHTMIQERIECSKTVSAAQSAYRGEVLAQLQGGKLIAPKPEADKPAALAAGTERSRQKQKPKLKSNRKAKIVRGSAQSKKAPDLALSTRSRRAHYA